MATYKGTQMVKGGYYLDMRNMRLEVIEGAAGTLPGDDAVRYVRVPLLALLVVAPVLGLLFVVLLPFLGLAVVVEQLWRKTVVAVRERRAGGVRPATLRRR
jgi:hypothetical protein